MLRRDDFRRGIFWTMKPLKKPVWLAPFGDLQPGPQLFLVWLSFLTPLVVWCAAATVPLTWHPLMARRLAGGRVLSQARTLWSRSGCCRGRR